MAPVNLTHPVLEGATLPSCSALLPIETDLRATVFQRPIDTAKELFIAATLLTLGTDIAHRKIPADVALLTELTLGYLEDWGYADDASILNGRTENGITVRMLSLMRDGERARIMAESEGRMPWGVSIAALDRRAAADLARAVESAREEVRQRVDAFVLKLITREQLRNLESFEQAVLRSAKSYEASLQLVRVDPAFTQSLLARVLRNVSSPH